MPTENSIEALSNSFDKIKIQDHSKMVTIQAAKEIAYTLRPFSGRSEHLESFINAIDKFHTRYGTTSDNSLSEFVFASICSKIVEEAGDFILCRPDLNTWPEIKKALRDKFGDRLDRNVLQQQFIFLTRHKNENIIDFLERIKLLKMRLNLKINSDSELAQATKSALIDQNEVTAVTVLISNTSSDLRTLLMIKNPKNIDEATSLVINHTSMEQQINSRHHYQLNTPIKIQKGDHNSKQNLHNIPNNYRMPHFQNIQNHTQNFNQSTQFQRQLSPMCNFKPQFPSQPINVQTRNIPKKYYTNEQVFGKPINVFSPQNSHKPQNTPKPMSITSQLTSKNFNQNKQPNHFRQTGPRNFISEELTNIEIPEQSAYYSNENFPHDSNNSYENIPLYEQDDCSNDHVNAGSYESEDHYQHERQTYLGDEQNFWESRNLHDDT